MNLKVSANNLFSHMLVLGIGSILDEDQKINAPVSLYWNSPEEAVILANGEDIEVGAVSEVVGRFLDLVEENEPCLDAFVEVSDKPHSPLSPRIAKSLTNQEWSNYFSSRRAILDLSDESLPLFSELVCSLGFPCYWSDSSTVRSLQGNLDIGASTWEMAPRNSGSEFMKSKYFKMFRTVSRLDGSAIASRLEGKEFDSVNELRNACGFHSPGAEDVLLSWIALHGIASFDVRPVTRGACSSLVSGVVQDGVTKALYFALPVPFEPITLQRYRAICRFSGMYRIAWGIVSGRSDADARFGTNAPSSSDAEWLQAHNVTALALFRRKKAGTANCPEYYAMEGSVHLLTKGRRR